MTPFKAACTTKVATLVALLVLALIILGAPLWGDGPFAPASVLAYGLTVGMAVLSAGLLIGAWRAPNRSWRRRRPVGRRAN